MKFMLLAATALLAAPVVAQDTTAPMQDAPTTMSDPTMQPGGTQPPAGDAMGAPGAAGAGQMQPGAPNSMPMPMSSAGTQTTGSGTPAGGYQPANPPMTGGAPGAPVVFQPSQSPSQAFPPPAPQENYPVCKKGQYDKCRQRGSR